MKIYIETWNPYTLLVKYPFLTNFGFEIEQNSKISEDSFTKTVTVIPCIHIYSLEEFAELSKLVDKAIVFASDGDMAAIKFE